MNPTLQSAAVWFPIALGTAIAMDAWAALLHAKVWHARLWSVHRSHHQPRRGRFERNDLLSVLHAPVALALILYGCAGGVGMMRDLAYGTGLGMTAFGCAYILVHDGLIHGRLPVRILRRVPYLRAVTRAHRKHHAGAYGGLPYGLFFGPFELARHRKLSLSRATPSGPRSTPNGPPPTGRARA